MAPPGLRASGRPARAGRGFLWDRRACDHPRCGPAASVAARPVHEHVRAGFPHAGLADRHRCARGPGHTQPRAARARPTPGGETRARAARPLRPAAALRGADAGTVRGRLRALADRGEPGVDRPPPRPAFRHGGHLAAGLSRDCGGGPARVRPVAAGCTERAGSLAWPGYPLLRLRARAPHAPGAALAAVRGRMKVAALLAALACLTATKAWIWIAAVAGFAAVDLVRRRARAGRRWPALAWAVPAIAVLVFLQLGFAPATHSVARGSLEVASATTRGSIPGGALARVAELALTYGRAALPLFAFGAAGLLMIVRRRSSETDRATLRFLHFPALVYLAAVFGLVAIGAYTGSHRYLYPALPSLALLAAAALDRYVPAIRLIGVAATGLVAVAFLPAFASFAADTPGLIAAGRAAAGGSGLLITDSPVVAFYSGRLPSEIAGSQQLPADRASAIEWMRSRGATELVVEDISYYRATTAFPELASGRPTPPFESLGQQSRYQVTGGKAVYAYRVGAALSLQSIYPGVDATLAHPHVQGKTATLAKGLTLTAGGLGIAGEGMGFGAPIALHAHRSSYPPPPPPHELPTAPT